MKYSVICLGCHGQNGQGQPPSPKIAGRPAVEIVAILNDFRAGKRTRPESAAMTPYTKALTDSDIEELAAYLAAQ